MTAHARRPSVRRNLMCRCTRPTRTHALAIVALLLVLAGNMLEAPRSAFSQARAWPPEPSLCRAAPLPLPSLMQIAATPPASPVPADDPAKDPTEGRPALPDLTDDLEAIVTEVLACSNAGDLLRTYALFSPDFLARR